MVDTQIFDTCKNIITTQVKRISGDIVNICALLQPIKHKIKGVPYIVLKAT